ncbi:hypothetical Protein YC6258_05771 [Gynuella sunshinyii YC6258]|uniref:Uncharacterized protein n=1 Tax=Gynuella sunshinyii YC6258 TaxID=1445510 RepID=A0A0C5W5D4_9GAMM|nr:DUF6348 family protein [Gynuella sunshinyii]AJQ97799.1 hypothetical Protein YC6258_05771 [Gynuella sunshinyii YC6258]
MEPITLEKELSELMSAHEIPFQISNEWIVPLGKLPAIRAIWYPREQNGCLEVEVLLEDRRTVTESFAGIGSGRSAINDALHNFCVNSFHVLLASLWGQTDPDQVLIEHWHIDGKEYTAFIGNIGTRGSIETNATIPDGFFPVIAQVIKNESLNTNPSWFRCFFAMYLASKPLKH